MDVDRRPRIADRGQPVARRCRPTGCYREHHDGDRFFLLHRPRLWNPREGVWMGHERKRGKLADLNALLRGGAASRFSRIVGDIAPLSEVRYVITLDTDTQMPRGSA